MKNHQMLYIEMSGCIYYTFSMVYILYFDTNSYPSSYHSSLNMGSELDTRHQLHEVYFLCADARRTLLQLPLPTGSPHYQLRERCGWKSADEAAGRWELTCHLGIERTTEKGQGSPFPHLCQTVDFLRSSPLRVSFIIASLAIQSAHTRRYSLHITLSASSEDSEWNRHGRLVEPVKLVQRYGGHVQTNSSYLIFLRQSPRTVALFRLHVLPDHTMPSNNQQFS
jgi:hypothetical protein